MKTTGDYNCIIRTCHRVSVIIWFIVVCLTQPFTWRNKIIIRKTKNVWNPVGHIRVCYISYCFNTTTSVCYENMILSGFYVIFTSWIPSVLSILTQCILSQDYACVLISFIWPFKHLIKLFFFWMKIIMFLLFTYTWFFSFCFFNV